MRKLAIVAVTITLTVVAFAFAWKSDHSVAAASQMGGISTFELSLQVKDLPLQGVLEAN